MDLFLWAPEFDERQYSPSTSIFGIAPGREGGRRHGCLSSCGNLRCITFRASVEAGNETEVPASGMVRSPLALPEIFSRMN